MARVISTKGAHRSHDEMRASTSASIMITDPSDRLRVKKPKRAETRKCPVCDELIPIRLLAAHSALESQRVEMIIKQIGSTEAIYNESEDTPGWRTRRSALKARKSLSSRGHSSEVVERAAKCIHGIKRRRKQRHGQLRDMTREDEENSASSSRAGRREDLVCPVCLKGVRGDPDVQDAHVDACLANENRRLEEECQRQRDAEELRNQEAAWEELREREDPVGYFGNVRGAGFHTRDRNDQDIEDDIDIDGDDEAVYGDAQFTERDVVQPEVLSRLTTEEVDVEIENDADDEAQEHLKTLHDLVAEGKHIQKPTQFPQPESDTQDTMTAAILQARKRGDQRALISALEAKVLELESFQQNTSSNLLCRICLDPYSEPTVSTGCWHTCCRECWLRCLGSTKLCPICKRITNATELRRVYL